MPSQPYVSPIQRKLNYVAELASPEGVELTFLGYEWKIPEYYFSVGFNLLLRFYIDWYLSLSLHLDPLDFDFFKFDFGELIELPPGGELERVSKAKYGESRYDQSIYDPEEITSRRLERAAWQMRYYSTVEDEQAWRKAGEALKKLMSTVKDPLVKHEVREEYVDALEDVVAIAEGKVLSSAYWDCAAWDVSPWKETSSETGVFKARSTVDWKTEAELETESPYESWWDVCRWDYARWFETPTAMRPEVAESLAKAVDEFQANIGIVEQHGYPTIPRRTFFLQRTERLHWTGGGHQIRLQDVINRVKALLNREGVFSAVRAAYIAFAQELYYLRYEPHRLWKRWKTMLTVDELVDKYVKMGLEEAVLNKIKALIPAGGG